MHPPPVSVKKIQERKNENFITRSKERNNYLKTQRTKERSKETFQKGPLLPRPSGSPPSVPQKPVPVGFLQSRRSTGATARLASGWDGDRGSRDAPAPWSSPPDHPTIRGVDHPTIHPGVDHRTIWVDSAGRLLSLMTTV